MPVRSTDSRHHTGRELITRRHVLPAAARPSKVAHDHVVERARAIRNGQVVAHLCRSLAAHRHDLDQVGHRWRRAACRRALRLDVRHARPHRGRPAVGGLQQLELLVATPSGRKHLRRLGGVCQHDRRVTEVRPQVAPAVAQDAARRGHPNVVVASRQVQGRARAARVRAIALGLAHAGHGLAGHHVQPRHQASPVRAEVAADEVCEHTAIGGKIGRAACELRVVVGRDGHGPGVVVNVRDGSPVTEPRVAVQLELVELASVRDKHFVAARRAEIRWDVKAPGCVDRGSPRAERAATPQGQHRGTESLDLRPG